MIDLLKSFGISDGGLDLSMTEGYRISIAADLPLDSESLGESVGSLIDSFKSGQPLTLSTLRELASSSYMKVSIEAVQEQSIGLDAEIVEAELTKRSTDTLVVFRKPVDGGWIVNLNP